MAHLASAPPVRGFTPVAELPAVTASVLKNQFGEVARLAATAPLAVSRHNRREFVILASEHYEQMQQSRRAPLESLAAEFDQLVGKMNTPEARRATASLFSASPKALGKAAVKARRAATHG
jgi:prevent-host-death family protein